MHGANQQHLTGRDKPGHMCLNATQSLQCDIRNHKYMHFFLFSPEGIAPSKTGLEQDTGITGMF